MLGRNMIKSWSSSQNVVALLSGEAEYYGLVKGASQALGMKNLVKDLGAENLEMIQLASDASAAIGIANRRGVGKVRHIEVSQLWLQSKIPRMRSRCTKTIQEII